MEELGNAMVNAGAGGREANEIKEELKKMNSGLQMDSIKVSGRGQEALSYRRQ